MFSETDQNVFWAAAAAAAQMGIVGGAIVFSKALLGVAERFGALANNRARGLIDRARNRGKEMKENTAYQRGKGTRKDNKKARKTERYASSGWRQRIAGGIAITKGQKEDREAVGRQAESIVRKHEAEQASIFAERFRREGNTGDDFLMTRAKNGHSAAERRAAMSLLAENGRVAQLRMLDRGGNTTEKQARMIQSPEDRQRLREIITANTGRLYGKAPDLNPALTPVQAFDKLSAADLASWHHSTIKEALDAANTDEGKGVDLRGQIRDAYEQALQTPTLRGQLTRGTEGAADKLEKVFGEELRKKAENSSDGGGAANEGEMVVPRTSQPQAGTTELQRQRERGGNFGGPS